MHERVKKTEKVDAKSCERLKFQYEKKVYLTFPFKDHRIPKIFKNILPELFFLLFRNIVIKKINYGFCIVLLYWIK